MKFGETEYSLREFGDARLLKKEAKARHSAAMHSRSSAARLSEAIAGTKKWSEQERAEKLEKAADTEKIIFQDTQFYGWLLDQCEREVNRHIGRLREIYAETTDDNTATDSNSDHVKAG